MKQRVKNISYLAKTDIDLSTLKGVSYDAVALPAGAEIMSIDLEVVEPAIGASKLDIGLKSGSDHSTDAFANDVDITAKANHKSSVVTTAKQSAQITLEFDTKPSAGRVVLRVVYFCPSEIMTEF